MDFGGRSSWRRILHWPFLIENILSLFWLLFFARQCIFCVHKAIIPSLPPPHIRKVNHAPSLLSGKYKTMQSNNLKPSTSRQKVLLQILGKREGYKKTRQWQKEGKMLNNNTVKILGTNMPFSHLSNSILPMWSQSALWIYNLEKI